LLAPRCKRYDKTGVKIELLENDRGPLKISSSAILLETDIYAKGAPPYFSFVE
jgi:hypothetical protein